MPQPENLVSLPEFRAALAARFPQVAPPPVRHWATGWTEIDTLEGGLPHHAVTELCSSPACGGFFLHQVLACLGEKRGLAALVDGARAFDPGSYETAALARLLTVFCETAEQSIKAADLLLRDGNLPLVLLDLQTAPRRSLGRIPASTWHRFQRLVERSGTALVVMTPQPIVEAARVRITLRASWSLAALKRPRRELFAGIRAQVYRRGKQAASIEEVLVQIA